MSLKTLIVALAICSTLAIFTANQLINTDGLSLLGLIVRLGLVAIDITIILILSMFRHYLALILGYLFITRTTLIIVAYNSYRYDLKSYIMLLIVPALSYLLVLGAVFVGYNRARSLK